MTLRVRAGEAWRRASRLPRFADPIGAHLLVAATWFAIVMTLAELAAFTLLGRSGLLSWQMAVVRASPEIVWPSLAVNATLVAGAVGIAWLAGRVLNLPALTVAYTGLFSLLFVDVLGVALIGRLRHYAIFTLALGLGSAAARAVRTCRVDRFMRSTLPAVFLALVVAAAAIYVQPVVREEWREARLAAASARSPHIVWVVMDTVRADHLSAYRYRRRTTPILDRLAGEGVLFENAIAPSSWTLPSHASMLTGTYPWVHGVEWNRGLGPELPTIGEQLQRVGYRTAAFSANKQFFSRTQGLDRGFLHFEDCCRGWRDLFGRTLFGREVQNLLLNPLELQPLIQVRPAEEITDDVLRWIGQDRDRPVFVVINYFDAHGPELPPLPFRTRFVRGLSRFAHMQQLPFRYRARLSPEQFQYLIDTYDGAISYIDEQLARLVKSITERGDGRPLAVVVTADHGELLREGGVIGHEWALTRPELHVPLVVWGPGLVPSGRRIEQPVSLVSLAPTLMELAAPGLRHPFPERPLSDLWQDAAPASWPYPLAELAPRPKPRPGADNSHRMRAVVGGGWHFIDYEKPGRQDELFPWPPVAPANPVNVASAPGNARVVKTMREYISRTVAAAGRAAGAVRRAAPRSRPAS